MGLHNKDFRVGQLISCKSDSFVVDSTRVVINAQCELVGSPLIFAVLVYDVEALNQIVVKEESSH